MSERKTAKKAAADAPPASFEDSMRRLEQIVVEMESGALSLEAMIARFEEGQGLIKSCTTTLNEVERRIEILVRKGDETVAEPFEGGDEADDAPADAGDARNGELF